ncbi:uncharacterized protein FRV6_00988 [Fusarium oxysporum]|uniref:Uncharacterized protein n=1 Tax=Fusarium oxysporum TaxID=5507 RepID=A0A2H3SJY9_FUSOX|nr:uncharacterized protein FRV6_00988 [Fusarium oxysporum]
MSIETLIPQDPSREPYSWTWRESLMAIQDIPASQETTPKTLQDDETVSKTLSKRLSSSSQNASNGSNRHSEPLESCIPPDKPDDKSPQGSDRLLPKDEVATYQPDRDTHGKSLGLGLRQSRRPRSRNPACTKTMHFAPDLEQICHFYRTDRSSPVNFVSALVDGWRRETKSHRPRIMNDPAGEHLRPTGLSTIPASRKMLWLANRCLSDSMR